MQPEGRCVSTTQCGEAAAKVMYVAGARRLAAPMGAGQWAWWGRALCLRGLIYIRPHRVWCGSNILIDGARWGPRQHSLDRGAACGTRLALCMRPLQPPAASSR